MRFAAGGAEVRALFLAWPGRNVDSGPGIAYNKKHERENSRKEGAGRPGPGGFSGRAEAGPFQFVHILFIVWADFPAVCLQFYNSISDFF